MRKSNYDKQPSTLVEGKIWIGWSQILDQVGTVGFVDKPREVVVVECYQGVYKQEFLSHFEELSPALLIDTDCLFKSPEEIEQMTASYMTNDFLFGYSSHFSYTDFLDMDKVMVCRRQIENTEGLVVLCGHGAVEVFGCPDILIYADMARWEIQQRFRRKEVNGLGVEDRCVVPSIHYKRGYFIDWIVCDNLKKQLLDRVDYWLDTHIKEVPKMIGGATWKTGLEKTAHRPFRVVPFFDPAPWGGQWMKEVCDLDKDRDNFGWCFDCVPEENSLYLNVSGTLFEMPSNNLIFYRTRDVLGGPVEARFGQSFPIRFDFLDTMGGGNLSLQVHPTTQYIRDTFGMPYTQDESYYLLDAEREATVFLGVKTGVDPGEMIAALQEAQETGEPFDAGKYVNQWPAKKHDHFLIPAGTIHCSGAGAMVLEISATPSLFTFKLWDWGRLGLDGLPRPINIGHGSHVIQWERQTEYACRYLVNRVERVAEGDGWWEERTGLHENEFIETRRHWFIGTVLHHTGNGVNVLNVIEGDELVVESPDGKFEPFVVHYAETFIVPASVGQYTISPSGISKGKKCGTIKAYVRFKQ
ncbi:class I mannose-6-phosphate isomerase [Parabacteroides sp.]